MTLPSQFDPYKPYLSDSDLQRMADVLRQPALQAIRLNTLAVSPSTAIDWARSYDWQIEPVPFCDTGWRLTEHTPGLSRTIEYLMGKYFIQDTASMLPAEMFSAHPAPLTLDLAAAPGGKTTHLINRFEDRGLVIANDKSASRINALRANLQTWGAINTIITRQDGGLFGQWLPNTFDRILLDAPCSGETLRENKGNKSRSVSDRERQQLTLRQIGLLESAFLACKAGGEIVYSTCTLSPDENEYVIDTLLKRYMGIAEVTLSEQLSERITAPGLTADGDNVFNAGLKNAVRLWPHLYQTSGFFAARITKLGETEYSGASRLPDAAFNLLSLPDDEIAQFLDMLQAYGMDFPSTPYADEVEFFHKDDLIYAVPTRFFDTFQGLPIVSAGLLIGQRLGDKFITSHEFAARFEDQFSQMRITLNENDSTKWLQGYDLRDNEPSGYDDGTMLIIQDERGRFLGRGKLTGNRVRNLLPKRLIQHG